MKGMMAGDDLRAPRRGAANLIAASTASVPELQKNTLPSQGMPEQALGKKAGQQRDVELDQTGETGVEHLLSGPCHGRMITAEGEYAKAA